MKNHFLSRLLNSDKESDFTDADRTSVHIEYDRLYQHKVLRVNYTAYDGRRMQDSIKPNSHADIMLLAPYDDDTEEHADAHPYRYARVLGVYHAIVYHRGHNATTDGFPQKLEFLWVRWFQKTSSIVNGITSKRLFAVSFVPQGNVTTDTEAFGFVDPKQVIRGAHLLPAFKYGKTRALLSESIARLQKDDGEDWCYYYVNRLVMIF